MTPWSLRFRLLLDQSQKQRTLMETQELSPFLKKLETAFPYLNYSASCISCHKESMTLMRNCKLLQHWIQLKILHGNFPARWRRFLLASEFLDRPLSTWLKIKFTYPIFNQEGWRYLDYDIQEKIRIFFEKPKKFLFGQVFKFLSVFLRNGIPDLSASIMIVIYWIEHQVLEMPAKGWEQHPHIEPGHCNSTYSFLGIIQPLLLE